MVKRVFAIIGIVLGSVAVFVGAVLGIYALMGRFRTPVVYPVRLEFADSEQTIVNDYQNGLYYFVLNGYSNNEYEVNQRTCFIDVLDGTDLIQLCSSDGTALSDYQDENGNVYPNRYQVNCNERIYYRLRNISSSHFEDSTFGRILIQARDERGQVQSNQLTIWVDRLINEIYLGEYNGEQPIIAGEVSNDGNEIVQTIPIGLEIREYFNVISTPNYSLHPISNLDEKIVEIYYFDGREYILLNDETISNYEFLHIDSNTNQMYFESEYAGSYSFKIAVFDTYASREEYLSDEANQANSNFERINNMVNTTVVFNVVNSDVEEVGINSVGVALDLYNESSIVLSSVSSTTANNLGLYMVQDGRETFSRFNELDFTLNNSMNWNSSSIEFASENEGYVVELNQTTGEVALTGFNLDPVPNRFRVVTNNQTNAYELQFYNQASPSLVPLTLTIECSNIALDQTESESGTSLNRILIDRLVYSNNETEIALTSASGSAFIILSESSNSLTLLNTGSYLEFYVHNVETNTFVRCEELNYSATSIGSGREKTFNIVTQNIPELGNNENLVLGVMVVNANGENHFAYVSVNIQEQDLVFSNVSGNSVTLDIGYELVEEEYVTVYDSLNFNEIISVTAGSYDACVFVTPFRADGNYDVEVLNGVTFIDRTGNSYVLVGTFEGGSYHNVVRAKNGSTNVGTTLYVIQLRNAYQQTAEEYINDVLFGENIVARYEFILDLGEGNSTPELVNVEYSIENEQITLTASLVNNQNITATATIENGNLVIRLSNGQTLTNPDLVKFFIDNGAGGIDVLLSDKSGTSENEGVADVVDAYILTSRAITVNTRYSIIASEINFSYNEESDANLTVEENGSIRIIENTSSHALTVSSTVAGMIENMYYANFSRSNISVRLYNENGELQTGNFVGGLDISGLISLNEDRSGIIISYESLDSFANTANYVTICLTYNGVVIESAPIYIESTAPTDIELVHTTQDEPSINVDLYEDATSASTGSTYIEATIGYEGDYTFTYQLVTSNGTYLIQDINAFFNVESTNNTSSGFLVSPVIAGKEQYLTYTSLNNNVLSFSTIEGQKGNIITINSTGSVVIEIQSGAITKYLRIDIIDDGNFELTRLHAEVDSSSFNINHIVSYTYNGTDISSNDRVNVENVRVTEFGGGREVEVVPVSDTEIGYNIQTTNTEEVDVILQIRKTASGWTFTRVGYQTVNLSISFDVVTLTGSVTANIIFNSSIRINQNPNWSNYYQGTSALLYETSTAGVFTNNSIFRITATDSLTIEVIGPNNSEVALNGNVITLDQLGVYRTNFYLDPEKTNLIETLSFTVEPNLILEANLTSEIYSDSTYDLSDFVTISAYDTAITYGTGLGEIYTAENLTEITDYSTVFDDEINIITMSSNLTTNSLFTLNNTDFEISTGWIERIGASVTETLTFYYGASNHNLGSIDVTAYNAYTYTLSETSYMAETQIDFGVPTKTSSSDAEVTLSSIRYAPATSTQIGVTFDLATQMFRFTTTTGQIEPISNVILEFTFTVGDQTLVYYTTEDEGITISPYVPSENSEIATAYSNNQYDLLRDIYNLNNVNSIITSFLVTAVSDPTTFEGSNTDFVGGGFVSGSNTQTGLLVNLNEIEGASKTIIITYQITYSIDNQTYTYTFTCELEIVNRQSIKVSYPFAGLGEENHIVGTNMYFTSQTDGENLGSYISTSGSYYVYSINSSNFEPVMINQTIDFDYDSVMNVSRLVVTDATQNDSIIDDDFTISIAGWEARSNITNYVNGGNIEIDNDNKTITFNTALNVVFGSGSYGYVVFKITSTSGNVAYYIVHLYNQTGEYPTASSQTVVTYEANSGIDFVTNNNAVLGVNLIETATDFANLKFTTSDFANLSFYILSAEMLDGSDFFETTGISRFSELTETHLDELTNYTNIKIGVVIRHSARSIQNLGVLNFYIQPIYEEKLPEGSSLQQSISNGEYTRTITINENQVAVPFSAIVNRQTQVNASNRLTTEILTENLSSGYEISGKTIIYSGNTIVSINDSNAINLTRYVRNGNLQFSVKYTYTIGINEFVLIVHYTYNELEIDSSAVTINNIGAFNGSEFNNRVNLTTNVLGDYAKTITINNRTINLANGYIDGVAPSSLSYNNIIFENVQNEGDVKYIYENGVSYLEFELLNHAYTKTFDVTFNDMMGETITKRVYANVVSGIYISFASGSTGTTSANPYSSSVLNENEYTSNNGSSITVEGTSVNNMGNDFAYREYTIGDLSIKTSASSSIEFTFAESDISYINNISENGRYSFNGASNSIYFVHTAQERDIPITIRIKSGGTNSTTYYMDGDQQQTITFYVRISKTYNGLRASYLTSNSNAEQESLYENVASGSTISNLINTLLTNDPGSTLTDVAGGTFLNTRRIYLLDLNNNPIALSSNEIDSIGFNQDGNPNELRFSAGNYSNSSTDDNGINLNISSGLTSNTQTNLGISNDAGVNISYRYRIIASSSAVGINALNDTSGNIGTTDYSTILISDLIGNYDEDVNEEIIILTKTAIGSTKEGVSVDMFISNASFEIDKTSRTFTSQKAYDATNGTTYTFTYSLSDTQNLTISLRLGTDNMFYISASKLNMEPFEMLDMEFIIYGTGGQISATYNIILYNYTVTSNYSTTHRQVYATSEIYLLNNENITIDSNAGTDNGYLSSQSATIKTDGSSYYNIGGTDRREITSTTNDLFEYNATTNIIKTSAVGEVVYVTLEIEVKDENDYVVAVLTYNFDLNVHFELVVNGSTLPSGNSEFNTNYLLTNSNINTSGTSGFYTLSYNSTSSNVESTVSYHDVEYYTELQLRLRDRVSGSDIRLSNISIDRELSNFGVTFDKDNYRIILPKDITGTLIIPLVVDTDNGTYTVNWNINIRGFVDLEYIATAGSNAIIRNNGEGFTTNTEVNLTIDSSSSDAQDGLIMTNTEGTIYNANTSATISIGNITPDVDYLILPYAEYQSNFNAVDIFNDRNLQSGIQSENNCSVNTRTNTISVTLPRVTQSLDSTRTYYLVVYRLNLTYLNNTTDNYYVTYLVYNNQSVNSNPDSTVNVDVNLDGEFLDLFYYKTTYTATLDGGEDTNPYYFDVYLTNDGGQIKVAMDKYQTAEDKVTYIESEIINNGASIIFVNGDTYYQLFNDYIYEMNSDETTTATYRINTNSTSSSTRYTDATNANIESLFTSNFNSIVEFKNFIENIDEIQFSNMTGLSEDVQASNGVVGLSLVDHGEGRFGIELLSNGVAPLKFNNSLIADLDVIMNSGESEVNIPAYANGAGFRLVASTEIRANTTDVRLGDIFLSSEITDFDSQVFSSIENVIAVQIIGVGTPVSTWAHIYDNSTSTASNGSFTVTPSTENLATLTVESSRNNNDDIYYLRSVTFTASGTTTNSLYNLQATYYYIAGASQIVKMDYSSSLQADYYQVSPSYNRDPSDNTIVSFNNSVFSTSGIIMSYSMQNTSGLHYLVKTNYSPATIGEVVESGSQSITTIRGLTITMTADTLNEYKTQGITSVTVSYVAFYGGSSYAFTFRVRFRIPTEGDPATPESLMTQTSN